MMKYTYMIIVALVLTGCSSFYYQPDQKMLKQANIFMQNGQTLEEDSQYLNALNTYMEAYKRYSLIDKLDGKAQAMLSLSREYYRLGDMKNFNTWRDSVTTLINLKLPQLKDQLNVLDIEINFRNGNYEKVIELSKKYNSKDYKAGTEMCSYRLISKTKLNLTVGSESFYLKRDISKLSKLYKKHKLDDPSILAYAYYSLGYFYTNQTKYTKAFGYLNKAYAIDQSEEHYSDIADDVYLMGFIYEKRNQIELARNSYMRALEIGTQTKDQELISRVNQRLNHLPK
ncbi:MAG TPA: hypothetical protein PKK33_08235 [Candidatus Cloacimonadota bacterium]|nr:hypothetical protein [Candidatus Cloacimonadota bacterium]